MTLKEQLEEMSLDDLVSLKTLATEVFEKRLNGNKKLFWLVCNDTGILAKFPADQYAQAANFLFEKAMLNNGDKSLTEKEKGISIYHRFVLEEDIDRWMGKMKQLYCKDT